MKYVALLRGINVGGNNKIKMAELKTCLEEQGLEQVSTYIQSGNVLFKSPEKNTDELTRKIEQAIEAKFGLEVPVVVLSEKQLRNILENTPPKWLKDDEWKYNYLILKPPYIMDDVVTAVGELKPDIEEMIAGEGVLYQSMLFKMYGRTTTGKIAGKPVYKLMTIRNHNTMSKLLTLLEAMP